MDIATMKSEGVFDENFIQRLFFFILVPRFLKTEIAAPSGEMAQGEFNSKVCVWLCMWLYP